MLYVEWINEEINRYENEILLDKGSVIWSEGIIMVQQSFLHIPVWTNSFFFHKRILDPKTAPRGNPILQFAS